ncbi:MAG: zinc metalloprotease HtpX [Desulfovibrionaceae bacterium]|nr:zinc metalloprotease HtpX [Desulfovibrionaceae bacterium]
MMNQMKTVLLLSLLSGLLIVIGGYVGGQSGIVMALGFALVMNIFSYWCSDKMVLKMYHAREVDSSEAPALHRMVADLASRAGVPMPRVAIVPTQAPNAFATGRNPEHAVVAVTEGILNLLSPEELRGVLAHELAHVAHRDILVQTVAGVIGSAITALASMLRYAAFFSGGRSSDERGNNPFAMLAMAMLAPIAAGLIQMAVSRSREYLADEGGAKFSGQPLMLARALEKLQASSQRVPMKFGSPATEQMFIVTPLFGGGLTNLFSTHPSIEERVARLREMAESGRY